MPVIKHLALLPILFHCGIGYSSSQGSGVSLKPENSLPDVPFELYSYCGENFIPVSKKEAQENLKKIPQNLSQSIRDTVKVPDSAWYEISGVYDRIREVYGIDIKVAKSNEDLNRIRVDAEVQSKLNEIASNRGLESHEVLQDQMINYLEGRMSLPDLMTEASCTLTDHLLSCISRREDLIMKINGAEAKVLNDIQAKSAGKPKRDSLIPIFRPNEESSEVLPVATIDFTLNRVDAKLAQELKEDFALFNISKFLEGRTCVVEADKMSCMLTEKEAQVSGRKWMDISAASFDAYGITIGHNAVERQKALEDLLNRNRNGFDKNDPQWVMHGGLDPTCMSSGCHQSGKFVKVEHSWTGKDRFKSIVTGLASVGGVGAIGGSAWPGAGTAIGGGVGIVAGGIWGATDPDMFGSPSGPLILPSNHPRDPGNDGVVYTGPEIKKPEAPVTVRPPSWVPTEAEIKDKEKDEKDAFNVKVEGKDMCRQVDSKTPCKVLENDPEAIERMARAALCKPIKRDMFDTTILNLIDDITKKKPTSPLDGKWGQPDLNLDELNRTVNSDCLLSGMAKAECLKPVEITRPEMPENIHFDPYLSDFYEANKNSGGSKKPVVAPRASWPSDGF